MQRRQDELLAKKAKLEELRRQRLEREARAKEHGRRESVLGGDDADTRTLTPTRRHDRAELDSFIDSLVGDRGGSRTPASNSPAPRNRLSSAGGGVQVGSETYEQLAAAQQTKAPTASASTQTTFDDGEIQMETLPLEPVKTTIETYNKFTQTSEDWDSGRRRGSTGGSDVESDGSPSRIMSPRSSKRFSRRQRARDEELREQLRKEIEEELKATKNPTNTANPSSTRQNFPARELTEEEMQAMTGSPEFLDFVDSSTKVIEKALEQDYDVLLDYTKGDVEADEDEDEGYVSGRSRKRRKVKQVAQFFDEKTNAGRMICDIGFSPKVCLRQQLVQPC